MTVPLTISPWAKRVALCFMASSIVSILLLCDELKEAKTSLEGTSKTPLPNDQTLQTATEVKG
jgi:hypothetical protein